MGQAREAVLTAAELTMRDWAHRVGRARVVRRAAVGAAVGAGVMFALGQQPAVAQPATSRAPSSPDSVRLVADLFFRAVADERWNVAAAMVDTTAVRRMVSERLRRRRQSPQRRELTIEDFMRDDPRKPRVVAEYELNRYRDQMARMDVDVMSHEFAGVGSPEALSALTALEATSRYLQAQDLRVQVREAAKRSACGVPQGTVPFAFHRILGVAVAADTAAYVLHDDGMFASRSAPVGTEPMVMQLRLRGGAWRILPGDGLLQRGGAVSFGMMSCDSTGRRPPG